MDDKSAIKSQLRKKCLCASDEGAVCDWNAVFRNVDQLLENLPSPFSGLGRASGCEMVSVAVPDQN